MLGALQGPGAPQRERPSSWSHNLRETLKRCFYLIKSDNARLSQRFCSEKEGQALWDVLLFNRKEIDVFSQWMPYINAIPFPLLTDHLPSPLSP